MKLNPRLTKKRVIARRITAPETKTDPASGKKIALLSYIDAGSYQQHAPTTKDIFLYAAGTNEEGEVPDGLDRLLHHKYVVHLNGDGKAIGLDVIPARMYRSGVVPTKQVDVKTITIAFLLGGAVARVTNRPANVTFDQSFAAIKEIDKLIEAGKQLAPSMRLGGIGKIINVTSEGVVEVRLDVQPRRTQGEVVTDVDDLHEEEEETEEKESFVAE